MAGNVWKTAFRMSDKPAEEKTAAEIATETPPKPETKPETPPAQKKDPQPAPAAPVKDEKWLDTEIAHTEDKLRTLRDQKKAITPKTATPKPATTATRKKTGWECDDLT
jgi:hypothetical protein